jgi:type VI protein secretion system component VasK
MNPILLDDVSFWDVVWWMIMVFFFTMFIWMFIAVFADIIGRNMSGFAKAAWILAILFLPLLGILVYMIFRPPPSQEEINQVMAQQRRAAGVSSTDEIARAHQLLQTGAINQAEFDEIKKRALV